MTQGLHGDPPEANWLPSSSIRTALRPSTGALCCRSRRCSRSAWRHLHPAVADRVREFAHPDHRDVPGLDFEGQSRWETALVGLAGNDCHEGRQGTCADRETRPPQSHHGRSIVATSLKRNVRVWISRIQSPGQTSRSGAPASRRRPIRIPSQRIRYLSRARTNHRSVSVSRRTPGRTSRHPTPSQDPMSHRSTSRSVGLSPPGWPSAASAMRSATPSVSD